LKQQKATVASRLSYSDVALCLSILRQFSGDSDSSDGAQARPAQLDTGQRDRRRYHGYLTHLQVISQDLTACLEALSASKGHYEEAAYLLCQELTTQRQTTPSIKYGLC
jgi:hypothetical protein